MNMLRAQGITVKFGDRAVLRDIDVGVAAGEVLGLIGPNAAGKTTLLRILAGLLDPEQGDVSFDGCALTAIPRPELARQVAYLEQDSTAHWPLTVRNVVAIGRMPHLGPWRRPSDADRTAVQAAMAEAEVTDLADRPVTALSGGERARVMLARVLAAAPRLLLADEPVAQLDPYHQIRVMELLRGLAGRGGGVLVVLHDLTLAARFCDRLILLAGGMTEAEGAPSAVLTAENLRRVYGVTAKFGSQDGESFVIPWRRADRETAP
jgi:iron complex transport system ATP-binding protein